MAANPVPEPAQGNVAGWSLSRVATFPGLRALAWDGDLLYASCGYRLLRAKVTTDAGPLVWQPVARYRPAMWRNLSSSLRLGARAFRDGFHALATLSSGHIIAAVPGGIIALSPGETEFRVSHRVLRGIRPLHITAIPDGRMFWGEYFDNPRRDQVHIYASTDRGSTWDVAHTFPPGAVRHVHNIVYDPWGDCLWIATGDDGAECRILRASCDCKDVEIVHAGNQQARTAALVPTEGGLYFSSDTPLERNHIYCLDRRGRVTLLADLSGSSIYGCRVGNAIFFSTMVEPSQVNPEATVNVYGTLDGGHWKKQLSWQKDHWPPRLFQYGNAFLPDGINSTSLLALATIAVTPGDSETSLWRVDNG